MAAIAAAVVLLGGGAGAAFGVAQINDKYEDNTRINTAWCATFPPFATSTPKSFPTGFETKPNDPNPYPKIDVRPYLMPDYETVRFPSRDPGVTIAGWWVEGASAKAPAVVLVHGRGKCRQDPEVLLPAGMLHRHGFSVLVIDLRNHGESTVTTGHHGWGVPESQDVLGAWDWVRTDRQIPADHIGVYAVSLGAGTSIIATGAERRVAALWEDSSFASFHFSAQDAAPGMAIPEPLRPLAIWTTEFMHPVSDSPVAEVEQIVGRPFAMVHGTADTTSVIDNAYRVRDAFTAAGGKVQPWILAGVQHVRAAFVKTAEYESRLTQFFEGAIGKPAT